MPADPLTEEQFRELLRGIRLGQVAINLPDGGAMFIDQPCFRCGEHRTMAFRRRDGAVIIECRKRECAYGLVDESVS